MTEGWEKYIDRSKDRGPRPLLVEAAGLVRHKDSALDLGAGAFNESKYLLAHGFAHVTAVNDEDTPTASRIAAAMPKEGFTYTLSRFEDFEFKKDSYDLICAHYSLPFMAPADFPRMFEAIKASLRPGGIFVGELFGDRDAADRGDRILLAREKAEGLFSGFSLLKFDEEAAESPGIYGVKRFWHVFHFIARKDELAA